MGNGGISGLVSRDASNSAMVDQILDISSLPVYLFERVACIRQFVRGSTIFWLIFVSSQRRFLHKKNFGRRTGADFQEARPRGVGPWSDIHVERAMLGDGPWVGFDVM